jgi:gliding motility-associated-like protein
MVSSGKATDAAGPCAYVPGFPAPGAPNGFAQMRWEFIPLGDTLEFFAAAATHEFPDRFPGGSLFMNTPDEFAISLTFDGQTQLYSPEWHWIDNTGPFNPAFHVFNYTAYSRPETLRIGVPAGKPCVLSASVRDGGDPWVDSALFIWGLKVYPVYPQKYDGKLNVSTALLCTSSPFEVRPFPEVKDYFYDWRSPGLVETGKLTGGGKRFAAATPGVYAIEADVYENLTSGVRFVTTLRAEATVFPGPEGTIFGPNTLCVGEESTWALQNDYAEGAEWDFGPAAQPRLYSGFSPPPVIFFEPGNQSVQVRLFNERCETTFFHTVRVFFRPGPPADAAVCHGQGYAFVLPTGYAYVWKKENGRVVGQGNVFETGPVFADSGYVVETNNIGCTRSDSIWVRVRHPRSAVFDYAFTDVNTVQFLYFHTPAPLRWLWDFGDGEFADERRPKKTYAPGDYTVTLVTLDSLGCRDTFSTTIRVGETGIGIPNAFTPNSDDFNGEFRIFARELDEFRLTVFNRYGAAVFFTNDPTFNWSGSDAKGRPLPEGVYAYRMTAMTCDRRPVYRTGTFTLIR